jgi:hypothetical protein
MAVVRVGAMSALGGGFNRSTQHLLILPDGEVCDGAECTDMVHAAAEGRALGTMEERSMRSGHRQNPVDTKPLTVSPAIGDRLTFRENVVIQRRARVFKWPNPVQESEFFLLLSK